MRGMLIRLPDSAILSAWTPILNCSIETAIQLLSPARRRYFQSYKMAKSVFYDSAACLRLLKKQIAA